MTTVLAAHRLLMKNLIASEAVIAKLKKETALSIKELQSEIEVASREVADRKAQLTRYNKGWRSKLPLAAQISKIRSLRKEIKDYERVITSMKRIQRLVKDNETARLPAANEDYEDKLCIAEDYEVGMRARGLEVGGMTTALIR
jgi:hypothetical protein